MATAEYWETLSDASFSFDGALTRVAEDGGIPARSRGAAWRWLLRDRVDATRKGTLVQMAWRGMLGAYFCDTPPLQKAMNRTLSCVSIVTATLGWKP